MNIDKTVITILLTLAVITAIPAALFFRKAPSAELSAAEKKLVSFSSTPVTMSESRQQPLFSGLDCPVKAGAKQTIATPSLTAGGQKVLSPLKTPGRTQATTDVKKAPRSTLSSLPTVSMIYSEGDTNVAIIGGQILHEGSSFGSYRVVKIENNRVLIKSAGKNIWLSME